MNILISFFPVLSVLCNEPHPTKLHADILATPPLDLTKIRTVSIARTFKKFLCIHHLLFLQQRDHLLEIQNGAIL